MKCPKCSKNHKKKYGMKCSCGYEFALDPTTYGMADGKLLALIRRASGNNTLYFTRNQLLTAHSKIDKASGYSCLVIGMIFIIIGFTFCLNQFPFQIISGIIGVLMILSGLSVFYLSKPNKEKLYAALDYYQSKHGKFEKLIETPSLDAPPNNQFEPDLYDYGVERILMVQRRILVDLLVKNKVHVQTKSLIVSADGYPTYLSATLERLLAESPELPVFFLHDSTKSGLSWAQAEMASSRYDNGSRKLVDMGVAPEDIAQFKRLNGLRLKSQGYEASVDVIPMAMLVNGIMVSFDQEIGLTEILAQNVASDSYSNFG